MHDEGKKRSPQPGRIKRSLGAEMMRKGKSEADLEAIENERGFNSTTFPV